MRFPMLIPFLKSYSTIIYSIKSCEILEVRGDLSINVEDKKSLRVDCQACKNYALALVLCALNNSKSI